MGTDPAWCLTHIKEVLLGALFRHPSSRCCLRLPGIQALCVHVHVLLVVPWSQGVAVSLQVPIPRLACEEGASPPAQAGQSHRDPPTDRVPPAAVPTLALQVPGWPWLAALVSPACKPGLGRGSSEGAVGGPVLGTPIAATPGGLTWLEGMEPEG